LENAVLVPGKNLKNGFSPVKSQISLPNSISGGKKCVEYMNIYGMKKEPENGLWVSSIIISYGEISVQQ
jgi:hypothetical protein